MTSPFPIGCRSVTASLLCALTCACAPTVQSAATVNVPSRLETVAVATTNADAADDPAIWGAPQGSTVRLAAAQVAGFIAGTDKKAGLYIFGLDGRQLQFLPEGLLNNVDLRGDVAVGGKSQVVIGASDRGRMGVALYLFDPASRDGVNPIRPWGFIRSDVVEPYGFCMGRSGDALFAILVGKDGQVRQYRIEDGAEPRGMEVRRFAVGSQSEGCVVDEVAGTLYVGEELKGVWQYRLDPASGGERTLVQGVDRTGRLIADVEGVTLIRDAGGTYLLVSSQGDSAFAIWRVSGGAPAYVGRFRVSEANGVDAVSGTDGLDAFSGAIGAYPEGIVVVQDDQNEGLSQNFKLIDWRDVRQALGL